MCPPTFRRSHARKRSSSPPGVKSLLDVSATVELLETLGVPVLGFRTSTLPLFYSSEGGPAVTQRVEDADEAARVAAAHWSLGGAGLLLANPPPQSVDVEDLIESAVSEAAARGVSGQAVTPFVLSYLHDRQRRSHARGQPGAHRRERAAGRRDRGSLRRPVSLYDDVKDLPTRDRDVRARGPRAPGPERLPPQDDGHPPARCGRGRDRRGRHLSR